MSPSVLCRKTATILSPLRYPGAKRRLAGYIRRSLEINSLKPELFIEPFAGGASVSIQLLNDGMVEQIGIADKDPLISAFWKTAFFDSDWLIEQVESMPITLDRWKELKHETQIDRRSRAIACLFLNRTSFSGILAPSAGPIGGYAQSSPYSIECRFPRTTLVRRIKQLQCLADRVAFVWGLSWPATLSRVARMQEMNTLPLNALYYFDPPFFNKADRLYTHYFTERDHLRLRDVVTSLTAPWILSYDSPDDVKRLYGGITSTSTQVNMLYSSSKNGGSRQASEVIVSNLPLLPPETRLWRVNTEWKTRTDLRNQYPVAKQVQSIPFAAQVD